jgi:hypothetical protein
VVSPSSSPEYPTEGIAFDRMIVLDDHLQMQCTTVTHNASHSHATARHLLASVESPTSCPLIVQASILTYSSAGIVTSDD